METPKSTLSEILSDSLCLDFLPIVFVLVISVCE